eukprot:gene20737-24854_t
MKLPLNNQMSSSTSPSDNKKRKLDLGSRQQEESFEFQEGPSERQPYCERDLNPVESAVKSSWEEGAKLLRRVVTKAGAVGFKPEIAGAIFCGHLVADLDSVAGALGAATLYGGTPARASEINDETRFALQYWDIDLDIVKPIEELVEAYPEKGICLVDFQQDTQLNSAISTKNIVGVIDHHALQNSTIVTERPIFVDIRPWGAMSSIIAFEFAAHSAYLPKSVAGMLLCAILSDTLNLRSPTTTHWDRSAVSMLVQYTGIQDVNLLCAQQFKAKSSSLAAMTAYMLVSGDLKQFKFNPPAKSPLQYKVAFSVVETTDITCLLLRVMELVKEMRTVKLELSKSPESPVDILFVALVDIVDLRSYLLLMGDAERRLAEAAYGEG